LKRSTAMLLFGARNAKSRTAFSVRLLIRKAHTATKMAFLEDFGFVCSIDDDAT
jgi:hypothetical protein